MKEKSIQVKMKAGLDARPVALLVQEASRYDSTIYIECGTRKINAKSIMGMMTLALDAGEELRISDGADEEAVNGMKNFCVTELQFKDI